MRILVMLLALAAAGTTGSSARADDGISGEASVGGSYSGADQDNAKFREYWYDMHSAFAVFPRVRVEYDATVGDADLYVDGGLNGRSGIEGRSTDGDADIEAGARGLFRVSGSYKRIGHNFAYGARSLYGGIGTGELHFNDPNLQPTMTAVSATYYKVSTLNRFVDSAESVNLGLRRDTVTLGVDMTALSPVTAGVTFSGEQRVGSRPFWSSFGMGNAVEIAEPIDYCTLNIGARVGYADTVPVFGGVPLSAEVGGAHSGFQNNIPNVVFDNPGGTVSMSNTYSGLPASGSNSLEPSNYADSISMGLGVGLPYRMRLSGHATVARLVQNSALPAMTVNPNLPFTPPSQTRAEMRVINSLLDGALTMNPVDRVHLKLRYNYRSHGNRSPDFYAPQIVNYDSSMAGSATAQSVSYIERTLEFEQAFDVSRHTRVTSTFEHERSTFVNGSSPLITQNSFKLAVDTMVFDTANVRVSGLHAARESAYPDYSLANAELPWMRKYYAADRNRDEVVLMTSVPVADDVDVSIEHVEGLDDYLHSEFGLQKDRHQASTLDVSYEAGGGVVVSTYYTQEQYATSQRSRQWNPDSGTTSGVGNPYSSSPAPEDPSNWTLDSTTVVRTFGMRSDVPIVAGKVVARIEGGATIANGRLDYSSVLSSTPVDATPFLPNDVAASDDSKAVNAGVSVRYQVTRMIWAALAYRYDLWKFQDDLLDGYTQVAVNGAGAYNGMVSMGTFGKNYEVHTVMLTVGMAF